ncbi:glycogen debranching protein [Pedobacter sp. P351]|uniref:alpha-L-rhamnosidase-related protein n=1 Tax=Pedobacter superstes TaxID=3133441 RepID=UPI0030A4BDCB
MKSIHIRIFIGLAFLTAYSCKAQTTKKVIYKSGAYSISSDEVKQGEFSAKALSSTELFSNYKSPVNLFKSPALSFKFSINGKDNEMVSGKDHQLTIIPEGGEFISPVIKFGQLYTDKTAVPANVFLKPDTRVTIRLDMREVLDAFRTKGFYTAFNGNRIYKEDFKSVYVAGGISPLIWDFDNLVNNPALELKDLDGDGIYSVTLVLNKQEEQKSTASSWKLSKDVSAFPQYKSTYPLADALYNMALEEMQNAVEPDSTFRTGKEWAGVWTRDISYSIILSMATLQPKVAEYSLLRKVKNNRVIQDTGTGGSYPVSSDRMIWAVAAWEVYKTTGNHDWLRKAYAIIKNSVDDDLKIVFDEETGLVKGESSFLDWREQTYPKWMQSADIYESECLGTSAVHFQTNTVLAEMAKLLGDKNSAEKYLKVAGRIKAGINNYLWMPEKGYYGQFLYGRKYKMLSPRSEALGEALAVIFNIADAERAKQVVANTPVNAFGIPCIYPQIPNIPPYHNNAVWPFVQSYWALAAAKIGNEESLIQSISAIYRPAALFLTNKENFVASSGDFAGTQINSSNMLWSLSGNISMIYKVFFGMDFKANSLIFTPFVPKAFDGNRNLKNFKYRNSILDIEMMGFGNVIKSITLDGKPLANAEVPSSLTGKHSLKIILANNDLEKAKVNLLPDYTSVTAPAVNYSTHLLSWDKVEGAVEYAIVRNGAPHAKTKQTEFPAPDPGEYQVIAIDPKGVLSFASEPLDVYPKALIQAIEIEDIVAKAELPYKGFSGNGFAEITTGKNKSLSINFTVTESGFYAIDFRYANGNGPTNTENKCAFRTLSINNSVVGTLVFPQRGKGEWSNWGFSNARKVKLEKGLHRLALTYELSNENMNGDINQAMLDYVRIIKIN